MMVIHELHIYNLHKQMIIFSSKIRTLIEYDIGENNLSAMSLWRNLIAHLSIYISMKYMNSLLVCIFHYVMDS